MDVAWPSHRSGAFAPDLAGPDPFHLSNTRNGFSARQGAQTSKTGFAETFPSGEKGGFHYLGGGIRTDFQARTAGIAPGSSHQ